MGRSDKELREGEADLNRPCREAEIELKQRQLRKWLGEIDNCMSSSKRQIDELGLLGYRQRLCN